MGIIDAWVLTFAMGAGDSSLGSLTVLRMFRLLRLVRLIRALRMFNELVLLVHTIATSLAAVAWSSLLLGMVVYSGSVLTMLQLGIPHRDTDPEIERFFGGLGSAIFSHFCVVTLDGWADVASAAMKYNKLWGVYFVFFIFLTNFALLNLMVGTIVERVMHSSQEQDAGKKTISEGESDDLRLQLRALFYAANPHQSGCICRGDIRRLIIHEPRSLQIMDQFASDVSVPRSLLCKLLECSNDEDTSFDGFYRTVLGMHGCT